MITALNKNKTKQKNIPIYKMCHNKQHNSQKPKTCAGSGQFQTLGATHHCMRFVVNELLVVPVVRVSPTSSTSAAVDETEAERLD